MLKFINYQLDDETTQNTLEKQISPIIQQTIPSNLSAFRRYNPQLLDIINSHHLTDHSVFCTKDGQLNIVNITTGRVTYSATPQQEMQAEVEQFVANAPFISVTRTTGGEQSEMLPAKADVVLMFGCGLGYQLQHLLQSARIRYLVIYEPEIENFLCSLHSIDWLQVFELAEAMGTQLSFQMGNAGTSIADDIQELISIEPNLSKIYLYRHLCHPVSDDVVDFLFENSGQPEALQRKGRQFRGFNESTDFVSEHPKNVLGLPPRTADISLNTTLFDSNMAMFARLYPGIHNLFSGFQPKNWLLRRDNEGDFNLWHAKRRVYFYDNPQHDSEKLINQYLAEPFKDDVIVGQASSEKFRTFIHFRYIEKLQQMFLALKAEKKPLPEKVDSLIVFGVALGLHVEQLLAKREIKNLYICEPNLDFFYASLFVTDWCSILTAAEQQKKRIYLNIGGDGSEYFHDFMGQFYQVGAYAIANTYMLPSYHTPQLLKAIQSLKQQFKVVLAMGEFYDHARFGIAHTYLSLDARHQFLQADLAKATKLPAVSLPVFIIGNGPSLDNCIEVIKEHRNKVILISCGTAIRSLHKMGIQPDFHAEVEQNRANYDWITQVRDPVYLKQIKLISVNGVHPDTAGLFANTYLALKDGEASTQIFRKGFVARGHSVASLSFSYPTVSNLALNYVLKLGFQQVYLLGVDLGYADINQHHSKHSAYYKADGKDIMDYEKHYGSGIPIKGNFKPYVFTKPEFDVSRQLIEKALAEKQRHCDVFNCSDGALIKGAMPLAPNNIIIQHELNVKAELERFLAQAYYPPFSADLAAEIIDFYDVSLFKQTMHKWQDLIKSDAIDHLSAKHIIDSQWQFLIDEAADEHNITFYLLYGSSNYFLSVLTKILPADDSRKDIERFNFVLAIWRQYLAEAEDDFAGEPIKKDEVKSGLTFT
ncbi:MAG: DUF115 domain-containing protein [Chromatiaceae bacterium]|nr:DUF115 domain-containing protein [Chromatiaceae bacterium]